MKGVEKALHVIILIVVLEGAGGDIPNVGAVLNPDHLHAAFGHTQIVVDVLVAVVGKKSQLESGGLHHAVRQGDRPELPR